MIVTPSQKETVVFVPESIAVSGTHDIMVKF